MARETVGERILRLRTERNLSLRDVSVPGFLSPGYISRVERGQRSPSVKALRVLAKKLDVSPDVLEFGHDNPVVSSGDMLATAATMVLSAWRQDEAQVLVFEDAMTVLADALSHYDASRGHRREQIAA